MTRKSVGGVSVPVVGASIQDFIALTSYDPSRVRVRIQFISPALAAQWLKLAEPGNRNKRPRRVDTIASDQVCKRFAFTGIPILFDDKGMIFDGRHRLAACVRSRVGFWTLVVTGIDRAQAMPAVDDVSPRTNGDRLKIIYPDLEKVHAVASICLLLWQFSRPTKSSSWGQPSFSEIERVFVRYRPDIEWVLDTIGSKIDPGCSSGGAPVLAPFVFVRSLNRDKIDAAANAYKSGDNLVENDPMRRLRQQVTAFNPRTAKYGMKQQIGNKNSSSQFSRFSMALYTLSCLERILTGERPRSKPAADPAVLERVMTLLKKCPKATRAPRARPLPLPPPPMPLALPA